jgi:hypothetical protein
VGKPTPHFVFRAAEPSRRSFSSIAPSFTTGVAPTRIAVQTAAGGGPEAAPALPNSLGGVRRASRSRPPVPPRDELAGALSLAPMSICAIVAALPAGALLALGVAIEMYFWSASIGWRADRDAIRVTGSSA